MIKISNVGTVAAINIRKSVRFAILTKRIELADSIQIQDKFDKQNLLFKNTPMVSLQPREYIDVNIRVSDDEFKEIMEGDRFHFEFILTYGQTNNLKVKYEYGITGVFERGDLFVNSITPT